MHVSRGGAAPSRPLSLRIAALGRRRPPAPHFLLNRRVQLGLLPEKIADALGAQAILPREIDQPVVVVDQHRRGQSVQLSGFVLNAEMEIVASELDGHFLQLAERLMAQWQQRGQDGGGGADEGAGQGGKEREEVHGVYSERIRSGQAARRHYLPRESSFRPSGGVSVAVRCAKGRPFAERKATRL